MDKKIFVFLAETRGLAGEVFLPFTRQSPLSDEGIHAVPVGIVGRLGFSALFPKRL